MFRRGNGSRSVKRVLDVVGAALLLILFLWLLLGVAIAIRLTSPGPIFFRQRRTGLDGKVFTILKFRTMRVTEDGEHIAHATRDDARITPFGRFLRRSSIDELPQIFNVLAGDMSLVGPRPHALAHDDHYGRLVPGYDRRFAVRPGLTGLAQVRGLRGHIKGPDCMSERVAADLDYAENWSVGDDAIIMARTIGVLVTGVNAV